MRYNDNKMSEFVSLQLRVVENQKNNQINIIEIPKKYDIERRIYLI